MVAVKSARKFKCLHCSEITLFDVRNRGRQQYCSQVECRRVSKAASQRRWLQKPENQDYFRGRENVERVRRWRAGNPGYGKGRRRKRSSVREPLQDSCPMEAIDNKEVTQSVAAPVPDALQEISSMQSTLLVGLIAMLTGDTLQEDIVEKVRSFSTRGQDILRMWPRSSTSSHENQNPVMPGTGAARAAPI